MCPPPSLRVALVYVYKLHYSRWVRAWGGGVMPPAGWGMVSNMRRPSPLLQKSSVVCCLGGSLVVLLVFLGEYLGQWVST